MFKSHLVLDLFSVLRIAKFNIVFFLNNMDSEDEEILDKHNKY